MSASRKTICRTFVCVPYGTSEQNITARSRCLSRICLIFNSRCRRVRFARFYIVCEEAPLGTPESPPIVSGVSDMHPSDCPNVEETRNPMQTFSRKKCSHFFPTNFHPHFHMKSPSVFLVILLITQAVYACCGNSLLSVSHRFAPGFLLCSIYQASYASRSCLLLKFLHLHRI